MEPKVSVIVPVYNVEEYLPRCLDSLVNQTLEDIEIIVVNDGSPDDSQRIIDEYAARWPDKIRPFVKENGGLSDARNFGIERAKGEYLAFVDSDDYVDLDMYEQMYARAAETEAEVVCCPYTYTRAEELIKTTYSGKEYLFGKSALESPGVLKPANCIVWNKIYNRKFWNRAGYRYTKGIWFEDVDLTYRILLDANKIEYVNWAFYYWIRDREDSISNSFERRTYDIFKATDSILDAYLQKTQEPYQDELYAVIAHRCLAHIMNRVIRTARSKSRKDTWELIDYAYAYFDEKLPNWESNSYLSVSKKASWKRKFTQYIRRHRTALKLYYTLSAPLRLILINVYKKFRKLKKSFKRSITYSFGATAANNNAKKELRRKAIQAYGVNLIEWIQTILGEVGITSFADFGTMLGLVREGHLLSHDVDIDMGVLTSDLNDIRTLRLTLERHGFCVTRQYLYGEQIVEESYLLNGLKIDFNYYKLDDTHAKTWLFYKKPGYKYPDWHQLHIAEMQYSPIKELVPVAVDGHTIMIPANAEQLLAEKYGENWRVPDTDWIYWMSPAATLIEEMGLQVVWKYNNYTHVDETWFSRCNQRTLALMRELHSEGLAIVEAVDKVCRENNLTYYLGEGSMLGAMRHKGFIPWDDDVDLLMPKEDYDKFLQLAPAQLGKDYLVEHYSTMEVSWGIFTKIRALAPSTFFRQDIFDLAQHKGPSIDIFPLSTVAAPESKRYVKRKKKLTDYRYMLLYKSGLATPQKRRSKYLKFKAGLMSFRRLNKKVDRLFHAMEEPGGEYYANYMSWYSIRKQIFPKEFYGQPRYVPFEGLTLPVPAHAEDILTKIYGANWNLLPKQKLRACRHGILHQIGPEEYEELVIY